MNLKTVEPMPKKRSEVSKLIKQRRMQLQLSLYKVAKMAGIPNQSTITMIEKGDNVKIHTVEAACRALGLELTVKEIS
jgi:transcriptional regulator with XRE-family HTH domain